MLCDHLEKRVCARLDTTDVQLERGLLVAPPGRGGVRLSDLRLGQIVRGYARSLGLPPSIVQAGRGRSDLQGRSTAHDMPVHEFSFDSHNERKSTGHGITLDQLEQLLENRFVLTRNRRGRSAHRLLIGRDHGGRAITVPLHPTPEPGVWYPVTAWYCGQ